MRIDPRAPVSKTGQAGSARRSGGTAFTLPAQDGASTTRSGGVAAAGPLDSLLAVQAQEDPQERKRRQARRGHDLLDGLDRLKAALLSGRVLPSELERLRTMLALRREATDDPRLDEVIAHIELRAAVELAKLRR
ncbi:flagellar assembly protein FliX [Bosea sp. (in: a-proteobacteria)]|uniref:flagellar assembly protein FliX n=1 Tax=Bosea sp. (in: a-proteobacteria) TaxID=1871050 RepID=UPI00262BB296|nr:flagellar assembly protein FliX [Bosea sp. (in: a-proteobacteria)]MCO5092136.1 flagellar assembly protein FliX [Bosea sp. (in: a-proteobacteria)]